MSAQQRFAEKYITSTEILNDLKISRTTLSYYRRVGKLKDPIVLSGGLVVLYERDQVTAFVAAWKQSLESKRNG